MKIQKNKKNNRMRDEQSQTAKPKPRRKSIEKKS
jgi:hypothetical protein